MAKTKTILPALNSRAQFVSLVLPSIATIAT